MARFWWADAKKEWTSWAQKRRFQHYRGLLRTQRYLLRQNLIAARIQAGLKQIEVADRLGQDQSFISKIESGKRQVEFVEVEHFAEIYKKPLSFFATASQNATKRVRAKPKKFDRKKHRVR